MKLRWMLSAAILMLVGQAHANDPKAVEAMMQKNGCFACHSVEQKIIGPAYRDVAKRYAGQADAPAKLVAKVKNGGGGVWGQMGMPPHPNLKDDDIRAMIDWVLDHK
jgi:cytochrome c